MNYTINEKGSAEVSMLKEKTKRRFWISVPIFVLLGFLVGYAKLEDEFFTAGPIILNIVVGGLLFCFLVVLPNKRAMLILKNTIQQIDIEGGQCAFKFSADSDARSISFNINEIQVIPADKAEISVFKGKDFIVFNSLGEKAYFIDEYWDESALILNQLDIKNESAGDMQKSRYSEFSSWLFAEEKGLRSKLFYQHPIRIVVFQSLIVLVCIKADISLLNTSITFLLFMLMHLAVIYPSLRSAKLMSHIVNKIEIDGGYCCLHCRNILKNKAYYDVYELNEISVGEREVYQERFFKGNKFMVLNAKEDKYYLMGKLLAEKEQIFGNTNKTILTQNL